MRRLTNIATAWLLAVAIPEVHALEDGPRVDEILENVSDPGRGGVLVVAHRACWSEAIPENSVQAIEACVRMGVDVVEIDLRFTKDGVPVLFHDDTVDRLTGSSGRLSDLSLLQVEQLRLRAGVGGVGAPLTEESIPLLSEVLSRFSNDVVFNIDVKAGSYLEAFEAVAAAGVADRVLFKNSVHANDPFLTHSSFLRRTNFMPILRQCVGEASHPQCVPLLSREVERFDRADPIAYEVTFEDVAYLREGIDEIADRGRLWVNTMRSYHAGGLIDQHALQDPDTVWGYLIEEGATIIQTDQPAALLRYLQKRRLHP